MDTRRLTHEELRAIDAYLAPNFARVNRRRTPWGKYALIVVGCILALVYADAVMSAVLASGDIHPVWQ